MDHETMMAVARANDKRNTKYAQWIMISVWLFLIAWFSHL